MLKKISFILAFSFLLCGCLGITEEQYAEKVEEVENCKKEYEALLEEYEEYKTQAEAKVTNLTNEVASSKTKYDNIKAESDSKTKTIEELNAIISVKANENLDKINDLFAEDNILATEIIASNKKWLVLYNSDYTIYDMLVGNQFADGESMGAKIATLKFMDWFDYDYVLFNVVVDELGTIATIEIDLETLVSRTATWEIE